MKQHRIFNLWLAGMMVLMTTAWVNATVAPELMENGRLPDDLRDRAVQTLQEGMAEEEEWVKVHAAEFLLDLSFPQEVRETFEAELEQYGDQPPYRIGIWRVLSKSATTADQRKQYIDNIIAAAADPEGEDRLHAIETLAKLGVKLDDETAEAVSSWASEVADADASFAYWLLAMQEVDADELKELENALTSMLQSEDDIARLRAAFSLSRFPSLSDEAVTALINAGDAAIENEPMDDTAQLADAYVMAAAWEVAMAHNDNARYAKQIGAYRVELERRAHESAGVAKVFANALADIGQPADAELLALWLDRDDSDLQLSCANGLLRLDRRRPPAMTSIDWAIIAIYFLGMIGIGVFYAGRTKNTDDYLLGGRHMKSWMVGLSLFATLLSTLTYLAIPGEMVRHGPIIVFGISSFPIVSWLICWFIIPFFMRLKVTSAYEILETRFGLGGRLMGSLMFLTLRFFWMAVILYATTDKVIVPLLGWTSDATPWICGVLGIITVIYSSLGGLRAVVLTDVIQTVILLGGAVLAIVVVTVRLGGVGDWWPTSWDPEWSPLVFFDTSANRTILMAFVSNLLWYVCTAGSDQMAIQRYLATTDVKAARRMFNITLLMNLGSWLILAPLGFALLAYYRSHPELLADGMTTAANADQLFPRFIAVGLPVGISGLVVAGLLAAAMSSLSSGINSSAAVISVDYVSRARKREDGGSPRLVETQVISWCIGLIAVLLSMLAGYVEGNLLDVVYKIGNLLVSPLFVLFFMALFIKPATWPATFAAVVCSVTAAVLVAFGDIFAGLFSSVPALANFFQNCADLGVLWIMPLSLAVGVTVGVAGSLIGMGKRAPQLVFADSPTVSGD